MAGSRYRPPVNSVTANRPAACHPEDEDASSEVIVARSADAQRKSASRLVCLRPSSMSLVLIVPPMHGVDCHA